MKRTKWLSVLLTIAMVMTLLPTTALAFGGTNSDKTPVAWNWCTTQRADGSLRQDTSVITKALAETTVVMVGSKQARLVGSGSYGITKKDVTTSGIVITPPAGYYVYNVAICCNDEQGLGCDTMQKGSLKEFGNTSVASAAFTISAADLQAGKVWHEGANDPKIIMVYLKKCPTPAYVVYELGSTEFSYTGDIVDLSSGLDTDASRVALNSVKYLNASDLNTNWTHTVKGLKGDVLSAAAAAGLEFDGWELQYYSTAAENGDQAVALSDAYGQKTAVTTGSAVAVTTHIKLTAKWKAAPIPTTGTLTVTKRVAGLDSGTALPAGFAITVTKEGEASAAYTLTVGQTGTADVTYQEIGGVHTWTVSNVPFGTYAVAESGHSVAGYALDTDNSTVSGCVTLSAGALSGSVGLVNAYIKDAPALTVTKSVTSVGGVPVTDQTDIPEAKAGDTITWNIVVSNSGNVALTGVTVTDTLTVDGAAGTVQNGTLPAGVTYDESRGTFAVASLAVGGSVTIPVSYMATEADAGKTIVNAARAAKDGTEGEDSSTVTVKDRYDVTVEYYLDGSKVTDRDKLDELNDGQENPFTLNAGESWSVAVAPASGSYDYTAPGTIAVGEGEDAVRYVFDPVATNDALSGTDIAADTVVGVVYNVDRNGDGIPDKYQVTVRYVSADLDMGTVSPAGEVLTITQKNGAGQDVWATTGTVIAEGSAAAAAEGALFQKWTAAVNGGAEADTGLNAATGRITIENAAGGSTYTFKAYFTEKTFGIDVEKTITYVGDEAPERSTAPAIPEMARVGDTVIWTIRVTNTGNVAQNVTVKDNLSGASGSIAVEELPQGVTYDKDKGEFSIAGLAAGGMAEFRVSYTVQVADAGKTLNNAAVVEGKDRDEAPITVENKALMVTKTVDKTTACVGDVLTYTITVTNTGNTDLRNVQIVDEMLGLADNKAVTLETLAAGESWSKAYQYMVVSGDAGKTLVNTVVAGVDGGPSAEGKSPATNISQLYIPPYVPPVLNCEDHVAYIIGYEDGTVRPENNITRAEVSTIFFRLLTDESRAFFWSQANPYFDVALGNWFNNAVSTLSKADIVTGYPDGSFRPNAPITRAEFAAIAARFSEVVYNGGSSFTDVPSNHWAARYIALAEHLGWIAGYPDGSFRPDQAITRAEAMTLINRVLERAVEEEYMLPNMLTWTDNRPGAWYYEAVQEATNSHEYSRLAKQVPGQDFRYESWKTILKAPDWAALEKVWSSANTKGKG